jgi:hypothetical protein
MNRVRVVAATAVVLGVAVVAGTRFQEARGLGPSAPQQTAAAPASQVTVVPAAVPVDGARDLAVATSPDVRAPISLMPATPQATAALESRRPDASVVQDAPHTAPQLTTASILSAADLVGAATDPVTSDTASPTAPLDESLQAELAACSIWVVVTTAAGAMLDTSIYAPCDRGADVRVDHAGLTFDARVGDDGQLMMMVPALIDEATVTVTFADGRSQSDTTFVTDLRQVERVALQWTGPADLSLHAYEFGAQFGEDGHIHAGHPQVPEAEGHGFLTVLGDPEIVGGHRVQVYSYPSDQTGQAGSVALEIEAPITEASCGKPLLAESIEMSGAAAARSRTIRLDMPACDGSGGYVVLPGVLPDLQIAALR